RIPRADRRTDAGAGLWLRDDKGRKSALLPPQQSAQRRFRSPAPGRPGLIHRTGGRYRPDCIQGESDRKISAGRNAPIVRRWRFSVAELAKSQFFSESSIALEVPFATHSVALARATFRIKQHPCAAAGRAGAFAGIMRSQPTGPVVGPADIGEVPSARVSTENIDVAVHVRPP